MRSDLFFFLVQQLDIKHKIVINNKKNTYLLFVDPRDRTLVLFRIKLKNEDLLFCCPLLFRIDVVQTENDETILKT